MGFVLFHKVLYRNAINIGPYFIKNFKLIDMRAVDMLPA